MAWDWTTSGKLGISTKAVPAAGTRGWRAPIFRLCYEWMDFKHICQVGSIPIRPSVNPPQLYLLLYFKPLNWRVIFLSRHAIWVHPHLAYQIRLRALGYGVISLIHRIMADICIQQPVSVVLSQGKAIKLIVICSWSDGIGRWPMKLFRCEWILLMRNYLPHDRPSQWLQQRCFPTGEAPLEVLDKVLIMIYIFYFVAAQTAVE